jgi:hypothetical protein
MNSTTSRLSLLAVVFSLLMGCGGSSSNGGTPPPVIPPPTTTTPDMGTAMAMQDGVAYSITNVSSGAALGIAGQSQVAGAALNLAARWHYSMRITARRIICGHSSSCRMEIS